eukprot:1970071-Prymnesium_polylepis.1
MYRGSKPSAGWPSGVAWWHLPVRQRSSGTSESSAVPSPSLRCPRHRRRPRHAAAAARASCPGG